MHCSAFVGYLYILNQIQLCFCAVRNAVEQGTFVSILTFTGQTVAHAPSNVILYGWKGKLNRTRVQGQAFEMKGTPANSKYTRTLRPED